jgi:hypothetical protein
MWLSLPDVQGGTPPDQPIVRSASIPHGDAVLALGDVGDSSEASSADRGGP